MFLDRIFAAQTGTPLITRDSLAQNQWETLLTEALRTGCAAAWPSQPLVTVSHWMALCWETAQTSGLVDRDRLLLTTSQTERLWRRVIEASQEGQSLISSTGVSAWARSARHSLFDCGLPPNRQRGREWQDDAAAFLRWNDAFERCLDENGWIDPDSLVFEISQLPPDSTGHDLLLLDPPTATTEITRLLTRWRAAGRSVESVLPDGQRASTEALIAGDPRDELGLSADWAARRLEVDAEQRLAVVVPDLDVRHDEVERAFVDRLGTGRVASAWSCPIGSVAIFGAALSAIELVSGRGGFGVISRWLRSPYFASGDANWVRDRAGLEIALRSDSRSQQVFAEAWQRHGLKSLFERKLPDTARRLDESFDRLPRRATPTTWTSLWQACLEGLGWQGFTLAIPEPMQSAWDNAWAEFSELTPIVGVIDRGAAFDAFSRIAASQSIYEPLPMHGVQLMSRISQIGPGFGGAWIGGFSDDSFPEPHRPNPLLPWSLQAAHALPGANPDAALEASRQELERLFQRVPEAVFSCPARTADQPLLPGPLVNGWKPAPRSGQNGTSAAMKRIGARSWEERIDSAPPLTEATIRGGTRTLDLQANAPAKAFCIARLRAEPLELPSRGIDPRLKGLLIHRALELLLAGGDRGPVDVRCDQALTQAFQHFVKPGDAVWDAQVDAERLRIERLLQQFVEIEAGRTGFTTVAVERRAEIEIGARRLNCRIDRIDRLEAGGEILIDYKTGQSVGARWFDRRLGDCQLPIYAQAVPDVAGVATIRLQGNEIDYRGAGRRQLSLPGKPRTFDDPDWEIQLIEWRRQLTELLDEFCGGDVRVAADAGQYVGSHAMDHVGGAFAPLTRIGDLE